MNKKYNIIVPRLENSGPVNMAIEIGNVAHLKGWDVTLIGISRGNKLNLENIKYEVRYFKLSDFFKLRGIIHTHCLRPDLLGWFFSFKNSCTLITTIHNHFLSDIGFTHSKIVTKLSFMLWVKAISRYDARICISNTMRKYYIRKTKCMKFDVIYNFKNTSIFSKFSSSENLKWINLQIQNGKINLIYVGSFSERKNINFLIDAVTKYKNLSLIICGRGGDRFEEVKKLIMLNGANDRIYLAGEVDEIGDLIKASHFLVLPSHAEGLPMVVLEAASMGRPSLMSNIAVHRELARMKLGEVFNRRDINDFYATIIKAIQVYSLPPNSDSSLLEIFNSNFSGDISFSKYLRAIGHES